MSSSQKARIFKTDLVQIDAQQLAAFEKNLLKLHEMVKTSQKSTQNAETRMYVIEREQLAIRDAIEATARQISEVKIINAINQLSETLSLRKPEIHITPSRKPHSQP